MTARVSPRAVATSRIGAVSGSRRTANNRARAVARVEIREIVDRDEHRSRCREPDENAEERGRDHPFVVEPLARIGLEHHRLQRAPLRDRKLVEDGHRYVAKEIGKANPRQARFRRGCARHQHAVAGRPRVRNGPFPHRRLADSGIAEQQQNARAVQRAQRGALALASYEIGRHVTILWPPHRSDPSPPANNTAAAMAPSLVHSDATPARPCP